MQKVPFIKIKSPPIYLSITLKRRPAGFKLQFAIDDIKICNCANFFATHRQDCLRGDIDHLDIVTWLTSRFIICAGCPISLARSTAMFYTGHRLIWGGSLLYSLPIIFITFWANLLPLQSPWFIAFLTEQSYSCHQ